MDGNALDRLTDLKNDFWHKFSALVRATLAQARNEEERDVLTDMLADSNSIYGIDDGYGTDV